MRTIITYRKLTTVLLLAGLVYLGLQFRADARSESDFAILTVTPEHSEYTLGEVITLSFKIKSGSEKPIEIEKPSVLTGNLEVYISADGANYKKYHGPNWGMLDTKVRATELAAGGEVQAQATIMHNLYFPTDHLNASRAEAIRSERIDSEYAISAAGSYWLKAVYTHGKLILESEPVAIEVLEPSGIEAVIWNRIKSNGAYAYFLQTGSIVYSLGSVKYAAFKDEVKNIVEQFPNTAYAESFGVRMKKHEKSLENLQKLKLEREKLANR